MTAHFVFYLNMFWGHLRPQLALGLNLLTKHKQLYITAILPAAAKDLAEKDLKRYGAPEDVEKRIKLVAVGELVPDMMQNLDTFYGAAPGVIGPLVSLPEDGTGFSKRPSYHIFDMFLYKVFDLIGEEADKAGVKCPPRWTCGPTFAMSWIEHWAPLKDGGHIETMVERAKKLIAEEPEKYGPDVMPYDGVLNVAHTYVNKDVFRPPNGPEMYFYEMHPQSEACPPPPFVAPLIVETAPYMYKVDGTILPLDPVLNPGVAKIATEMFGNPIIEVGPQIPDRWWHGDFSKPSGGNEDAEVIGFLDAALKKHGANKVVYISFGSFFFPFLRPDLVFATLDALEEAGVPYVFTTPGAPPPVAEELKKRNKSSNGLGLVVAWAPQVDVLRHEATGFFISHGGSNSTSEAVMTGTPVIYWPITADQPLFAAHLSLNLDVAFELVQVRNGPTAVGLPTKRGIVPSGKIEDVVAEVKDVLKRAMGDEGARKRKNMKALSEQVKSSWESGEARENMKVFEQFL